MMGRSNKLNILLSAYACEPHKGSEPGVGWNWAVELAKSGNAVWVITRANNAPYIGQAKLSDLEGQLNFVYFDLPGWLKWWKRGGRGVHLYYFLWQVGAFFVARALVKRIDFNVVHHVTFVSARQPSFMGLLGIPFVFGPVAGGENIPVVLRKSLPWRARIREFMRDMTNWWVKHSPSMRLTFSSASRIFVTSEQTRSLLPRRYGKKSSVQLAIGVGERGNTCSVKVAHQVPRILFVGQLVYLKGIHLALNAFAQLAGQFPGARFTIIGSGPDESWLKRIANEAGVEGFVDWKSWAPHAEVVEAYKNYDILLFPSLRDSGGMVVLEAMSWGLPVVCLDLGGPGVMVDNSCGRKVSVVGSTEAQVILAMRNAMAELLSSDVIYSNCSKGAMLRAAEFKWGKVVARTYGAMREN